MGDRDLLRDFVALCQKVGLDPAYVQGWHGSASVKLSNGWMAVTSGERSLRDVGPRSGFVVVEYANLREDIMNGGYHIPQVVEGVGEAGGVPTSGAAYHALLGRVVLHTHNMYANVLSCTEEGEQRLADVWPDAYWVQHTETPKDMAKAIAEVAVEHDMSLPLVIVLQNHGVIVSASTAEEAWDTHEALTERLLMRLGLERAEMPGLADDPDLEWMRKHVLFRQQMMFMDDDVDVVHSPAAREIYWVHGWLVDQMVRLGLTPRYLGERRATSPMPRNMHEVPGRSMDRQPI